MDSVNTASEAKTDPVVTETKVEAKETEKKDDFDQRFEALSKRERAILAQKKELEDARSQWSGELKAFEEFKKIQGRFKEDPLAILEAHGFDYDKLTQFMIDQDKVPKAVRDAVRKVEEFERKQEEATRTAMETESKKKQESYKDSIEAFIAEKVDNYEFLAQEGRDGVNKVFEFIRDHWQTQEAEGISESERKVLSFAEAADELEKELEAHFEKYTKLKKFQSKFGPKEEKPTQSSQQDSKAQKTGIRNLTNSGNPNSEVPKEPKNDQERLDRFAKMLKFT